MILIEHTVDENKILTMQKTNVERIYSNNQEARTKPLYLAGKVAHSKTKLVLN